MKLVLIGMAAILLVGCDATPDSINSEKVREEQASWDFANALQRRQYSDVSNVRPSSRGYILYDIENGSVTCREHSKRNEMTCWANGKVGE